VSCVATCDETEVFIWDVQTARVQRRLVARVPGGPSSVALSPDGQMVAAGVGFSRISLWNLGNAADSQARAEPMAELAGPGGHKGEVRGLSFSPDGKTLASSSVDGRVILWDVAAQKPLAESLIGTGRTVWSVAYQPGGLLLAIANGDGTVSLRDARSGDRIGPFLRDHGDGARSVAFRSDGAVLASAGLDGRVILWDTSPESWAQRACHVANRNLSLAEWRKYLGEREYQQTCPELPAAANDEP
jgi:WD40 repeat protein